MVKPGKLYSIYQFYQELTVNPRFEYLKFHKKYKPYRSKDATYKLLNSAFDENIIVGPFLFCNYGFTLELLKENLNPLKTLRNLEKGENLRVTHAIALSGDHTLLSINKGGRELVCAESIIPTFESKMELEHFNFTEIGKLGSDDFPQKWTEEDWQVFDAMRNPRIPFVKVARTLDVSWITIKRRYEKIINDCKTLVAFFPKSYSGYARLLVAFKTKYETGVKKSLELLDRSTYLWKFKDMLVLILFVDDYNRVCERFNELEEIGMIHDLCASIPIRYYEPYINLDKESQDPPLHQED